MDKPSLIEFPCEFPLKIIGNKTASFVEEIIAIVLNHFPETSEAKITTRPSDKGNFIAITATVYVINQEGLDALYQALTSHPEIRMVL